jgi:REP element-mobilizing transposase RayT
MITSMPRKPRFFVLGVPVHIVQRGNNRQTIFFEEIDYEVYLSFLLEALDCGMRGQSPFRMYAAFV